MRLTNFFHRFRYKNHIFLRSLAIHADYVPFFYTTYLIDNKIFK